MNIRSTGTTKPAEAKSNPVARPAGANVVVLSTDQALITLLRDSLAGSHRVWRADDQTHAADLVIAAGNAVLLVDSSLADQDTRGLVSAFHDQFPDLAVIVAGRRDDETRLADLVSQGVIYRFLHKPASAERIRNFIDATQRREQQGADLPAAATPPAPLERLHQVLGRLPRPWLRLDRNRVRRWLRRSLLLIPLLALVAALASWQPWRRIGALLPERNATPVQPADPGQQPAVLRLLDAAGIALSQGRLTDPPERNAFELYQAVLARHPGNPIALQGIERIADQVAIEAGHALDDRDLPRLAAAVDTLRSVRPDHPRLGDFRAGLARERSRQSQHRPAPSATDIAVGRAQDAAAAQSAVGRVHGLVQLASDRMASDQLVGGPDSAYAYLLAARRLDPADAGVRQGILLLGALLENNARRELAAGRLDRASSWVHDAIALNHDRAALSRLRADLERARLGGQQADALLPRALPPPAPPAPPPAPAAAPEIIPEARLERRYFRAPDYPERAVLQRLAGWVDLEFTVAADGTTRAPRIVAADPAGVFERATLDAVARWRYAPVLVDGVAVDQRVAMRLRFELAD